MGAAAAGPGLLGKEVAAPLLAERDVGPPRASRVAACLLSVKRTAQPQRGRHRVCNFHTWRPQEARHLAAPRSHSSWRKPRPTLGPRRTPSHQWTPRPESGSPGLSGKGSDCGLVVYLRNKTPKVPYTPPPHPCSPHRRQRGPSPALRPPLDPKRPGHLRRAWGDREGPTLDVAGPREDLPPVGPPSRVASAAAAAPATAPWVRRRARTVRLLAGTPQSEPHSPLCTLLSLCLRKSLDRAQRPLQWPTWENLNLLGQSWRGSPQRLCGLWPAGSLLPVWLTNEA